MANNKEAGSCQQIANSNAKPVVIMFLEWLTTAANPWKPAATFPSKRN